MVRSIVIAGFAGAALLLASPASAQPTVKQQCIASNEGGQDLRQSGKIKEAIASFEACAIAQCPAVLRNDCVARAEEAKSALPAITIVAKDAKDGHVVDAAVRVDDVDFDSAKLDPGEHKFTFSAPGYMTTNMTLRLAEKQSTRVSATLVREPPPAPPKLAPLTSKNNDSNTLRTVSYVLGAAGIATLGGGTYFGLSAHATYDDALRSCGGANGGIRQCDDPGVDGGAHAHDQALASTILIGAGIALVAGAIVTFVLSSPKHETRIGAR